MENNALTPSPAPVPEPGTNMPEFAAAPTAQQEPVIPQASSMPDFGAEQQIAQLTVQPTTQPAPQPVEPVVEQPVEPVAEQPVEQPTAEQMEDPTKQSASEFIETIAPIIDAPVDSSPLPLPIVPKNEQALGEIRDETRLASEIAAEQQAKQAAEQPVEQTQTVEQLVAEATQTQTPSTPITLEKKKVNIKLFALIGAVVVLLGGGIITFMLLNQPKPVNNNPQTAPVVNVGPDTSTPFAELTSSDALAFLDATTDYKTYFPETYTNEDDLIYLDGSQTIALFYSYDKKDNILKTIKTSPVVSAYKDKLTSDNVTIVQDEVFASATIDSTAVKCKDVCYGLIFNKKYLNYYNEPIIDPATGAQINVDHIMLVKHEEKDIERYAPLVAAVFMNGQKIYSTELKKFDDILILYTVNTVEYQPDSTSAVQTKQTFFTINVQTGEMLYHPEMTLVKPLEVQVEENELEEPNA